MALDLPEYLTSREAADLVRVSCKTLENWRGLRVGPPFVRAGSRRVLYRRSDIERWLSMREVQPHPLTGRAGRARACGRGRP